MLRTEPSGTTMYSLATLSLEDFEARVARHLAEDPEVDAAFAQSLQPFVGPALEATLAELGS